MSTSSINLSFTIFPPFCTQLYYTKKRIFCTVSDSQYTDITSLQTSFSEARADLISALATKGIIVPEDSAFETAIAAIGDILTAKAEIKSINSSVAPISVNHTLGVKPNFIAYTGTTTNKKINLRGIYVKYKGNTIDAHYDSYYNQCKAGYNSITNSIVKFNTIYDDWVTGTMILAYVPDN